MQLQGYVAHRVGQIEAHRSPYPAPGGGDTSEIKELPAVVLHAGPEHEGQLVAGPLDGGDDVLVGDRILALPRPDLDEVGSRIEAVVAQLRLHGVLIAGEGTALHDDLAPPARRAEEADHHEVQVDGEGVGGDHLRGPRPYDTRQPLLQVAVVAEPAPLGALPPALHAAVTPAFQFLLQVRAGGPGL